MSQLNPAVEGGRALLRGRLFGFPVHLDLSFVIIMGILGYYPGVTLRDMALWLLITPVAVLVHEFGHAVVARATGARPQIALAGFGGVTSYVPTRPLSRVWSLGISLAGPAVGLVIGAGLAYLLATADLDRDSWQQQALFVGKWTTLGWSLLNLLPVLPLDGGQAMRELLPGDPAIRERRAAIVSVVTASLAALVSFAVLNQVFLTIFLVFFAVSNVLALREGRRAAGGERTPAQAIVDQLWLGEVAQARRLLADRPPDTPVDPAVHGAVLALTGDREQGLAVLDQELRRRPEEATPAALLALTLTLAHDWDRLIALLQGPDAKRVPRPLVDRAIQEARGTGREDVAGRLTVLTGAGGDG